MARKERFIKALSKEHFDKFDSDRVNILHKALLDKQLTGSTNAVLSILVHRTRAIIFERRVNELIKIKEIRDSGRTLKLVN